MSIALTSEADKPITVPLQTALYWKSGIGIEVVRQNEPDVDWGERKLCGVFQFAFRIVSYVFWVLVTLRRFYDSLCMVLYSLVDPRADHERTSTRVFCTARSRKKYPHFK